MVQQPLRIIETEQQRADLAGSALIAKAAHHAIGRPPPLDLQHRALAAQIWRIQFLGDDSVPPVVIEILQPAGRDGEISRAWGDDQLSSD